MTSLRSGTLLTVVAAVAVASFYLFAGPIAQDPGYHHFADTREILGIPNFWNVVSNLPFLAVGVVGVAYVARNPDVARSSVLWRAWLVLFAGIALTAFGSAYYHLAPANRTLAWDRLPMTLGFAGLFTIVVGEYVSLRGAALLLLPLLVAGAAAVFYWDLTETRGFGDLRPYAVVQFLPILLMPAILAMHRGASDLDAAIWLLMACYVAAKLFEQFDAGIYSALSVVSGHTLKHLAAALAPAILILALQRRRKNTSYA